MGPVMKSQCRTSLFTSGCLSAPAPRTFFPSRPGVGRLALHPLPSFASIHLIRGIARPSSDTSRCVSCLQCIHILLCISKSCLYYVWPGMHTINMKYFELVLECGFFSLQVQSICIPFFMCFFDLYDGKICWAAIWKQSLLENCEDLIMAFFVPCSTPVYTVICISSTWDYHIPYQLMASMAFM